MSIVKSDAVGGELVTFTFEKTVEKFTPHKSKDTPLYPSHESMALSQPESVSVTSSTDIRAIVSGSGTHKSHQSSFLLQSLEQTHEKIMQLNRLAERYTLVEEIGRGGVGVIYKAWQPELERYVALKLLQSGTESTPTEVERFYREARLAARLNHPNIVAIHDVGLLDGAPYFAMELVEGIELAEYVQQERCTLRECLFYVFEIALALEYMHRRGVVHRDIKLSNILIDQYGDLHIIDFGLAQSMKTEGGKVNAPSDQFELLAGTPEYMPPEVLQDPTLGLSPSVDIYGVGVVLYHLLTGQPIFEGATPLSILRQRLEKEPTPPHVLYKEVPEELSAICMLCLSKDPSHRFSSARDLADALKAHLSSLELHEAMAPGVEGDGSTDNSWWERVRNALRRYAEE